MNSLGTDLEKDERKKLYPTCGYLHPDGLAKLARADEVDQVRLICDGHSEYRGLFDSMGVGNSDKSFEDKFFEKEVRLNKVTFMQQFHFGLFYSYLKLKEQEIRNLVWIAECISQQQKEKINAFIPIF